jgi:hypothetical protein
MTAMAGNFDHASETSALAVERVTRIELALSAWESDRSGSLTALTWAADVPPVTLMHPVTPGLMARQWPGEPVEAQAVREANRTADLPLTGKTHLKLGGYRQRALAGAGGRAFETQWQRRG